MRRCKPFFGTTSLEKKLKGGRLFMYPTEWSRINKHKLQQYMSSDQARPALAAQIKTTLEQHQCVIITGESGRGQQQTAQAAVTSFSGWSHVIVDGHWLRSGYLAGFHDLFDAALDWCDKHQPNIISRHQQSLKRLFPFYQSCHFTIPKDLTNTSTQGERTRFYHHEYQNKLLVGASRFLHDYLEARSNPTIVVIDHASLMSPTALKLLAIIQRNSVSSCLLKFILLDYDRQLFDTQSAHLEFPEYSYEEMTAILSLEQHYTVEKSKTIYQCAKGNVMMARAIIASDNQGLPIAGYMDGKTIVDLYISTLSTEQREELACNFILDNCQSEDYIVVRNYNTFDSSFTDVIHEKLHGKCMTAHKSGSSPLNALHGWSIKNKFLRLKALAEISEMLMNIGLYDSWLSYFGEIFADPALRSYGSGDESINAAFINAAFVLYSLGCARASTPFLDQFYSLFPKSKFIPTVLYARSMIHGRYQQPVDLQLAEKYALLNLATIEERFGNYEKYHYIKVFAENAYAYIKARQGKYNDALELCIRGNQTMLQIYGDDKFKLHQSILIYNTSQIYEIIKNYELAELQLRLAISYDPYYGEYYNDLGNLLSQIPGRTEEAMSAYGQAIDLCPPYYEAYLNRGVLHRSLGNHAAARNDFESVLDIKPTEWRALTEFGNISLAESKFQDALQWYRKALSLEPLNAELHNNAGLTCSECGDTASSIDHYEKGIALNPRHADAHNNLAIELYKAGRREESLQHAMIANDIGGSSDYAHNLQKLRELFSTA